MMSLPVTVKPLQQCAADCAALNWLASTVPVKRPSRA
jgi:hypothetical protein